MPQNNPQPAARAVFLDRDGVIIEDSGYVGQTGRINILPGVEGAVRRLNKKGFKVIIITNQAGVARGFFTEDDVNRVNSFIKEKLAVENAVIDAIYYCPHHVEGTIAKYAKDCDCRKPKTGMIDRAAADFKLDIKNSYLIGDNESDIEAGRRAGCVTIMLNTGKSKLHHAAAHVTRDLPQAVDWLLETDKAHE